MSTKTSILLSAVLLVIAPAAARAEEETAPPAAERIERWKQKLVSEHLLMNWNEDGSVATSSAQAGPFELVSALGPDFAEVRETAALLITKDGELETETGAVVGTADLNGDGRPDLVLFDGASLRVFSDTAQGPKSLAVSDKGGAFGWKSARLAERDGQPSIVATTQTTHPPSGVPGPPDPYEGAIVGITEEVTLQWSGSALVAVARKPLETAAQVAVRQRAWEAAVRQRAADDAKRQAEQQRQIEAERRAAAARKSATQPRPAPSQCKPGQHYDAINKRCRPLGECPRGYQWNAPMQSCVVSGRERGGS